MRIAERSFNANAESFNKTRDFYRGRLSDRGIDPEVLSPLEEAEAVIGTPITATNPQTGEKLILINDQWQPMGASPRG